MTDTRAPHRDKLNAYAAAIAEHLPGWHAHPCPDGWRPVLTLSGDRDANDCPRVMLCQREHEKRVAVGVLWPLGLDGGMHSWPEADDFPGITIGADQKPQAAARDIARRLRLDAYPAAFGRIMDRIERQRDTRDSTRRNIDTLALSCGAPPWEISHDPARPPAVRFVGCGMSATFAPPQWATDYTADIRGMHPALALMMAAWLADMAARDPAHRLAAWIRARKACAEHECNGDPHPNTPPDREGDKAGNARRWGEWEADARDRAHRIAREMARGSARRWSLDFGAGLWPTIDDEPASVALALEGVTL